MGNQVKIYSSYLFLFLFETNMYIKIENKPQFFTNSLISFCGAKTGNTLKKKYEVKINEGYIVVSPLMKIMTIKIFFLCLSLNLLVFIQLSK